MRTVRDANLETRTARARLKVQGKPHYRLIERGLHLGFRKLPSGPGMWVVRRYLGDGRYAVENLRTPNGLLVLADDFAEPDGRAVMSFAQAQRAARVPRARAVGGLTVADVVADYLRYLESDGRSAAAIQDARYRIDAHVLPMLGKVRITVLSPDRLRNWRDSIADAPPRVRTSKGQEQRHRAVNGADGRRARRATANRAWSTLRAALNHAFAEGRTDNDEAWRRVRPYRAVNVARLRYLSVDEARRLVNACPTDFRNLVRAALATGCRYAELARLVVADFDSSAGTLAIRQSKTGKPRQVVLNDEGAELFRALCAGRPADEFLLRKADGMPWTTANQIARMRNTCRAARISPAITFHGLRHTWASLAVMGGLPIAVVAKNLGHATTQTTERHYGHLAPSYVADAIRSHAPRFGLAPEVNVTPLRKGGGYASKS